MFFKKSEAKPTVAEAAAIFRKTLTDAIRAAHQNRVHWRNIADALQSAADAERIADATSGRHSAVRYDGFYRPIAS